MFKRYKFIDIDKKKIEYMTDTIFEFFKMGNEEKYLNILIKFNKNEFLKLFINKIKKVKDKDKEAIKKEYEVLINDIDEKKYKYISFYIKILEIFFEKK